MPARVVVAEYDSRWPELFQQEYQRLSQVLKERALRIEHAGSKSVPGLAAKPVIDIVLVVTNSGDEDAYLPGLPGAVYSLRIREPEWFAEPRGIGRTLLFRDWLRKNAADREFHARTKIDLAKCDWHRVQDYADAKTAIVTEIMNRAPRTL